MNQGYGTLLCRLSRTALTDGTVVIQKDNVSDCYGISLDRLPAPPLPLWYQNPLLMWYRSTGADNALRRHSTTDIPVLQSDRQCTPGRELIILFSDIGGTDRWTWFVGLATIPT